MAKRKTQAAVTAPAEGEGEGKSDNLDDGRDDQDEEASAPESQQIRYLSRLRRTSRKVLISIQCSSRRKDLMLLV